MNTKSKPQAKGTYFRRMMELFEAEAWLDLYTSTDLQTRKDLGLNIIPFGKASATVLSGIDILALNRVCGAGINDMYDYKMLNNLSRELKETGIKRFFFQLSPDTIQENSEVLLNNSGFIYYNNWVKLYRKSYPAFEVKTSTDIKLIEKKDADLFSEILLRSFEWPDKLRGLFAGTFGRFGWRHYLAYEGEKAAGTSLMYTIGDFAWLGFAATLPEFRNKGIQSAMLRKRIEDASLLGAQIMIIETAENKPDKPSASNRNVIRAGFETAYIRPNYLINF